MEINEKITDLFDRWIEPMLGDIRRILDITYGKEGPENHGVNFSANALILNGIDFVSNFYLYPEAELWEQWNRAKTELLDKLKRLDGLNNKERKWLVRCIKRESGPRDETQAAKKFIEDFFPEVYKELAQVIWSIFRHGHIHLFVPKTLVGSEKKIPSAVGWMYRDKEKRVGLSIADLENYVKSKGNELVRRESNHLNVDSEGYFTVVPHLFFLDFCEAVRKFRKQVEDQSNESAREAFSSAYDRWVSEAQIKGTHANELIKKIFFGRVTTGKQDT